MRWGDATTILQNSDTFSICVLSVSLTQKVSLFQIVYGQVQCFRSDGSRHPVAQNLSVARYSLGAAIVSEPRPTLIAAGGIGPVAKTKNPHSCAAPNVCQWTGVVDAIPL